MVCSKHFDESSIIFTPKLRPDAIPQRFVQELKTREQATQTKHSLINIVPIETIKNADTCSDYAQTDEIETRTEKTQTTMDLSANTPRKRKLSDSLHRSHLEKRKLQYELNRIRKEVQSNESVP